MGPNRNKIKLINQNEIEAKLTDQNDIYAIFFEEIYKINLLRCPCDVISLF